MASSTESLVKGGGCSTRDTCRGTYHTVMRRSFGRSNTTFTPSVGRGDGELGLKEGREACWASYCMSNLERSIRGTMA